MPGLGDDLLEEAHVLGEGPASGAREGVRGGGTSTFERFRDGDVTGLEEGAEVRGDVAVGHAEGVAEFGVEQAGGGREEGHDGQASLFVDHPVELEEGLGVHTSLRSVAAR